MDGSLRIQIKGWIQCLSPQTLLYLTPSPWSSPPSPTFPPQPLIPKGAPTARSDHAILLNHPKMGAKPRVTRTVHSGHWSCVIRHRVLCVSSMIYVHMGHTSGKQTNTGQSGCTLYFKAMWSGGSNSLCRIYSVPSHRTSTAPPIKNQWINDQKTSTTIGFALIESENNTNDYNWHKI